MSETTATPSATEDSELSNTSNTNVTQNDGNANGSDGNNRSGSPVASGSPSAEQGKGEENAAGGDIPSVGKEGLGNTAGGDGDLSDEDGNALQEATDGTSTDLNGPNDGEDELAVTGIAANDVKNIILLVVSPYFDDGGGADSDGGGTTADVPSPTSPQPPADDGGAGSGADKDGTGEKSAAPPFLDEDEDTAQRYDHIKAKSWVQLICDGITDRLVAMGKPFKFVTHVMVMRKCGAGMHICSSNFYSQTDGWISHAHDLSPHIYAVVTVYWMAV